MIFQNYYRAINPTKELAEKYYDANKNPQGLKCVSKGVLCMCVLELEDRGYFFNLSLNVCLPRHSL